MKLILRKEAQPFTLTQEWGVLDPATYKQFGFSRHNGIDIVHGYNSRIRAPFPYQIYRTIWQPNGGGLVLSIVSTQEYDAPDGKPAHVIIDYMHLAKYIKTQGSGEIGDLLCIAGNTGFSTGPHTHIAPRWVRFKGNKWVDIDKNDANNTFDPMPYYTVGYAVDYKEPAAPVLVPVDDEFDATPILEAVKESVSQIGRAPEANRPLLISLFVQLIETLSRALTKG